MLPYLHIGKLQIPMYGLCMATAMLVAVFLSYFRTRRRGEDSDKLLTIALFAIVFGIIGAKLLYFFVTYTWQEFVDLVKANGILYLMEGGLVFYGGLIGGLIGAYVGSLIVREKLHVYSDPVVPTLPLAHAIGRMGCFCSGCCYGRATDSWIGMTFPNSITGLAPNVRVIPTQLIEAGINILIFVFLLIFTAKRRKGYTTLFVYVMLYGVMRFLLEFLRGDDIRGFLLGLSTSQWISIGLIVLGAVGLILTCCAGGKRDAKLPPDKEINAAQKGAAAE
ncbi:MAG: prolipoprotein diacylglyceryl transferase [Clostridiales bacterium]|nr:prolipoprotein diacylglyceryl transferase [Clostridiales bacterium]